MTRKSTAGKRSRIVFRKFDGAYRILGPAVSAFGCALGGFGELDMLMPAYAATIHKSKGSEYPAVIIPVLAAAQSPLHRRHQREATRRIGWTKEGHRHCGAMSRGGSGGRSWENGCALAWRISEASRGPLPWQPRSWRSRSFKCRWRGISANCARGPYCELHHDSWQSGPRQSFDLTAPDLFFQPCRPGPEVESPAARQAGELASLNYAGGSSRPARQVVLVWVQAAAPSIPAQAAALGWARAGA